MKTRRFSTTFGVFREASKFWKPAMPARCIHSRSSLIPSFVILPFIQCHHTRGRAPLGGFSKPCYRASDEVCAHTDNETNNERARTPANRVTRRGVIIGAP